MAIEGETDFGIILGKRVSKSKAREVKDYCKADSQRYK